jgi:hypothetical protein
MCRQEVLAFAKLYLHKHLICSASQQRYIIHWEKYKLKSKEGDEMAEIGSKESRWSLQGMTALVTGGTKELGGTNESQKSEPPPFFFSLSLFPKKKIEERWGVKNIKNSKRSPEPKSWMPDFDCEIKSFEAVQMSMCRNTTSLHACLYIMAPIVIQTLL